MSSAVARLRQTYGDIDISSGPDAKAPRLLDGLHRRQGKARAAGAPSCRELYPMHLISVVTFLGLDELLPHQTLKRRGLLSTRTDAHAGRILFISHQWLGWTTADPEGAHLRALQKLLRRLISGFGGDIEADYVTQMVYGDSDRVTVAELAAALPHSYLWLDYISMPQNIDGQVGQNRDGMDAINSIPAYVEHSTLILVLAPPCFHKDERDPSGQAAVCNTKSWRSRGWCRMEYVAAVLAKEAVPIIQVVSSPPRARADPPPHPCLPPTATALGAAPQVPPVPQVRGPEYTPECMFTSDALTLLAGEGRFTCCARGHNFGKGLVPCDKLAVRGVMAVMFDAKIDHLHQSGELHAARWLTALQPWLMRGLPPPPAEARAALVIQGGARAARKLARRRPVAAPPKRVSGELAVARLRRTLRWRSDDEEARWTAETGMTLLLCAAVSGDVAAVRYLLAQDASAVGVADKEGWHPLGVSKGMTPLHGAMMHGEWEAVEALLDAKADPHAREASTSSSALTLSCLVGRDDNVREWLARFPDHLERRNALGITPLMLGSLYARGRPATSRVLLAARADPTARSIFGCNALHYASENADSDAEHMRAILAAWPRDPAARGGVAMVADVPVAPEGTMRLTSGVARLRVSCCGNRNKLVRYLASIDGMTALHIAAARGDVAMCRALLDAGADPTRRDAMGMSALEHARWWMSGSAEGHAPEAIEALLFCRTYLSGWRKPPPTSALDFSLRTKAATRTRAAVVYPS